MHHLRLARHVALGALLAGTVAVGAPSLASAASTCTFDHARKEMTVIHDAPSGKLTLTSAATLQFRDGSGVTQSCYSPQGVAATASNVDTILVKASKNMAGFQTTVIDERNGAFAPGATPESNLSRIRFHFMTGGSDRRPPGGTAAGQ